VPPCERQGKGAGPPSPSAPPPGAISTTVQCMGRCTGKTGEGQSPDHPSTCGPGYGFPLVITTHCPRPRGGGGGAPNGRVGWGFLMSPCPGSSPAPPPGAIPGGKPCPSFRTARVWPRLSANMRKTALFSMDLQSPGTFGICSLKWCHYYIAVRIKYRPTCMTPLPWDKGSH